MLTFFEVNGQVQGFQARYCLETRSVFVPHEFRLNNIVKIYYIFVSET